MKITEIRNLDLFKYSLIILFGSIVILLFPFIFFLFHYKQPSKSTLVNFFYIFSCFGVGILLLNAVLLFWVLNQLVKSNNRQQLYHFEANFFQLLNYLHDAASKLDPESLDKINYSIRNFLLEERNDNQPLEHSVDVLMSSLRSSSLKSEASASSEYYFRQLNTLLTYIYSTAHPLVETEKYLAIIEAAVH